MNRAALRQADAALRCFIDLDDTPALGSGPLSGIRLGVKGNIDVMGLATTAGAGARRHAFACADAPIVARLRGAGALIVGTLNMHIGALGATTDNQAYGRCINPWAKGFSPGGSSGGSGAAIAAGFVDAALGTDTMGSIRLPSAYCGVFGWKPDGALIDPSGAVPLSPSLDQIGPLAKDPETLWAVARAMGGPEPLRSLSGVRLGVPTNLPPAQPGVQALFEATCARLVEQGLDLVPLQLDVPASFPDILRAALLVCEAEGAKVWAAELDDPDSDLEPVFRAMLDYGRTAPAARIAAAYQLIATTKQRLRAQLAGLGLSAWLSPTATHVAFDHDVGPPLDQAHLTMLANIADLPSCSAPMGLARSSARSLARGLVQDLPAGIMITAAPGRNDIALGFAGLFKPLALPVAETG